MGSMSKRKGAAGEREAAAKLNEVLGTRFHRGRQYRGGPESPDLAGDIPGLHVEVKRCERLRLYEALRQAGHDACVTQVPIVMHRTNRKPWVIILAAEDLIRLLDAIDEARAKLPPVVGPIARSESATPECRASSVPISPEPRTLNPSPLQP